MGSVTSLLAAEPSLKVCADVADEGEEGSARKKKKGYANVALMKCIGVGACVCGVCLFYIHLFCCVVFSLLFGGTILDPIDVGDSGIHSNILFSISILA